MKSIAHLNGPQACLGLNRAITLIKDFYLLLWWVLTIVRLGGILWNVFNLFTANYSRRQWWHISLKKCFCQRRRFVWNRRKTFLITFSPNPVPSNLSSIKDCWKKFLMVLSWRLFFIHCRLFLIEIDEFKPIIIWSYRYLPTLTSWAHLLYLGQTNLILSVQIWFQWNINTHRLQIKIQYDSRVVYYNGRAFYKDTWKDTPK